MFQLRSIRPHTELPAEVAPKRTEIVLAAFSPSTEAIARGYARLGTGVVVAPSKSALESMMLEMQLSLETQELDHSAEIAAIDEVRDTIDKFNEAHPHTGPLQVYLLDGQGKALMDQNASETAMGALVIAALNNKKNLIAALLPQDETISDVAELPPALALRQLAETTLSMEGIPFTVGKKSFETFLANPKDWLISREAFIEKSKPVDPE